MSGERPKVCVVCGREIQWRKKWERDWDSVKYCSKACRSGKLDAVDTRLENVIIELLESRDTGKTICTSEAARLVDAEGWRALMERARRAARRLVSKGRVEITQDGKAVDPSSAKGPVRVRLRA